MQKNVCLLTYLLRRITEQQQTFVTVSDCVEVDIVVVIVEEH